jgi:ATP-dependent protease HslVU (ClpYQ) peptidase subunit
VTTVLGYAVGGEVVMVADSRTNIGDRPLDGAARKIMRLPYDGGELLVGVSGNAGMPGRIRAAWPESIAAPPAGGELQEWAEEIAGVLTQAMLDSAMTDGDGRMESEFLLAAAGRLWTVYHHAAVPHADGRAAVGTGGPLALAALDVALDSDLPPEAAVVRAAIAAIGLDMWSGPPLQVELLSAGEVAAPQG